MEPDGDRANKRATFALEICVLKKDIFFLNDISKHQVHSSKLGPGLVATSS